MKPDIIKTIFTNLLFVIGVILLIFGFSRGVMTVSRIAVFDTYPLPTYEETRCELEYIHPLPINEDEPRMSEEEAEKRRSNCLASLEHQRKVRMVEDITTSFTTIMAGLALVLIFRRNILK